MDKLKMQIGPDWLKKKNETEPELSLEVGTNDPVMLKGCGYTGCHFGATYDDAECFNGQLYDMDDCDDGLLYEPFQYIPCPNCNKKEWAEYLEDNQRPTEADNV